MSPPWCASASEWQAWIRIWIARSESRDEGLEIEAFEQLHDVVEGAVLGRAEVVDVHGVRRPQRGRCLRLALETPHELVPVAPEGLGSDQLDGRRAGEQAVARPPDLAHAAAAEQLFQLVAPHLVAFLGLDVHLENEPRHDQGRGGGQNRRKEHLHGEAGRRARVTGGDRDQEAERIHCGRRECRENRLAAAGRHDQRVRQDPDGHRGPSARGDVAVKRNRVKDERDAEGLRDLVHEADIEQRRGREHLSPCHPGDGERKPQRGDARPEPERAVGGRRAGPGEHLPVRDA
jgi:hypothetical protein